MYSEHSNISPEIANFVTVLPGNYLLLSPQLNIVSASNTYLLTTNKNIGDILGKYIFDVFPVSADWAAGVDGGMKASLDRVLATGTPDELPVTRFDVLDANGKLHERYWQTVNTPFKDANGKIQYIIHQSTEVIPQVGKENALNAALDTFHSSAKAALLATQMEKLFHDIPAQIAIVRGPDMIYDYVNPQYQRELFPGRDVLGLPLLAALPEVAGQPIWHILQKVLHTGEPYIENEICIPLAAETGGPVAEHYFNLVYQPLRNEKAEVYGLISFKYEVTAHVEARKQLEQSRHELTALNASLNEANHELQAIHEELKAANEELTASNEELKQAQESLLSLNTVLESRIAERTQELEKSLREQQSLNEEITGANEELAAANEELAATNEELSETQQLLTQSVNGLTESEQRFRNLVRDATVGVILLTGPELKTEIVNEVYSRLIGRTVNELQDKNLFEVIPEAESVFRPVIERVRDSGESLYLYDTPYLVYKDGKSIEGFLNLVYQPYREADGQITGVMVLCQDVTEQVQANEKLSASESRFRFLLNAIPQQVWTAKPDGALDYVNQVVAENFGYPAEEVAGQGWQAFIHADDLADCLKAWQASLTTGEEYQTEFRLRMKDGSYRWHLSRAVPYREGERITMWLGTNTDIELQKSNEQKKDEFLSIASHELKTPLTSIKAFNQLMQRMSDPMRMTGFIQKSADHIARLESLIGDLLDVTRINAGKVNYDLQPFDFAAMINDAVESVQLKSENHQLILERSEPLIYTGDRLRLEQVITNFLNNAVKYSPKGGHILVNTRLEETSIVVSVQDFGIGIEPDHLDKLFDRYYRVDNTAMRFEGLGLGLYISSEILKRHGGTFWIESKPNEGSTFYFRLPLAELPAQSVIDDDVYYQDSKITIIYNAEKARLDVDWTGFQDIVSVQNGGAQMLRMLAYNRVNKVFNDNRNVLGNWSEAADWAGKEWFPAMEAAGLRFFAWIFSESAFAKLSAEKSVAVKDDEVDARFFTDAAEADAWLDNAGI